MSTRSWPQVLGVLADGGDLTADDTSWAIDEIFSDHATSAQIAAFGVALKIKGPTPAELSGMAAGMLAHARLVHIDGDAVDIVGTGGDRSGSVNISTMSSIVVAAAGVPVVKHGNRAASSKSGGADVLEALGVRLALGPEAVARCVREVGIGFCFAPLFHPALRFAGPARKQIGIPTVFNVLGPLTNPAQPRAGLVGCAFPELLPTIAGVFAERGASALVVRGRDGLDEITTSDVTETWVVSGGRMRETVIDPTRLGIARVDLDALRGGDAQVNAGVARDVLAGVSGPVRDAVLVNSAAAIVAYDLSQGYDPDADLDDLLGVGIARAAAAIDSGKAAGLLDRWVALADTLGDG
ncbi:anthranilate phosphoribosyltransferase [Nocardia donostiensis]|uniref:Anthranilate phosphoribosyltransferase n=1 Tax=Nocardia donostiensis TaxID=1538463 RepID=A0A1V2T9B1_9NOCA|nr:anthranilate phosphoribosyltransferase [Nocardia donostiensis]ONM46100.1 anthranilate phosphoribosyltransferase [Nocardia donostiensis]OQS12396.1 anthranilate phosphoribosyltransferase [Nocardia donostiensis]OQS17987.1 anthranilate phosphoribosyltransferase [Nocardia donostiensis]